MSIPNICRYNHQSSDFVGFMQEGNVFFYRNTLCFSRCPCLSLTTLTNIRPLNKCYSLCKKSIRCIDFLHEILSLKKSLIPSINKLKQILRFMQEVDAEHPLLA